MSMDIDFLDVFYGANENTNFTAQLFRLIAKADPDNLGRLSVGFRRECSLYLWWMGTPEPPERSVVKAKAHEIEERMIREEAL